MDRDMNRRHFMITAGAAASGWLAHGLPLAAQGKTLVEGKAAGLTVLSEQPVVLETPLALLADRRVTPTDALFVRNSGDVANAFTVKPRPAADWKVELHGTTISVAELLALDQVEQEMVLQCAGNGRFQFSQASPIKGTPWGRGGMGNVRFKGVPLSAILKKWPIAIPPAAKYLTARGQSPIKGGDFEHSIPLDEALRKSFLAVALNGEPLPPIHGGPVRLVTPGYYGTMHVKWLTHLRFEANESANPYQLPQYRTPRQLIKPGEKFEFTYQNSLPTWRMKIVSFILAPEAKMVLPLGRFTLRGVAFNDGEARIDTVLVSLDQGQTWSKAELETPASPYAWYPWKFAVALKPGLGQVWARAIDTLGRTQPLDGNTFWNPNGYEWNGVDKVAYTVQ